jgi:putative flippase GtrA
VKYATVGTTGFFIDASVLYVLTEYGHIWYILSEAFATLVAFVTNYAGNTLWTYRDAMKALRSPHSGNFDNETKVKE